MHGWKCYRMDNNKKKHYLSSVYKLCDSLFAIIITNNVEC